MLMYIKELLPEIKHLDTGNFLLIAGPCVVENEENCLTIAEHVVKLSEKYAFPYIFKASYKKANRSKLDSFTGIGDREALEILKKIKNKYQIPVLTDIHTPEEAYFAAGYADILQIPAFLCRQTDLLVAAAKTGKVINIKKGQFLAPDSMRFAKEKVVQSGNNKVMLTDRGTMFGYHDLIVDYRGLVEMKKFNCPVILDITHSLQQPNQPGGVSGGQPEMIETIARAGVAVGVDGIFLETHPEPEKALSDGANMLKMQYLEDLLIKLIKIRNTIKDF
ncbi:MAG: 3-deoxy-8-phosphooctulonate synthase [Bacteroidales bacterium]|nr:3-deoxy-8-phosphooctulonate synthase [Bacteroidales bacterium]